MASRLIPRVYHTPGKEIPASAPWVNQEIEYFKSRKLFLVSNWIKGTPINATTKSLIN